VGPRVSIIFFLSFFFPSLGVGQMAGGRSGREREEAAGRGGRGRLHQAPLPLFACYTLDSVRVSGGQSRVSRGVWRRHHRWWRRSRAGARGGGA
jgi:hypothetical protein